jgi:uncharacterized membrane protein YkvA (DUF1232 family)
MPKPTLPTDPNLFKRLAVDLKLLIQLIGDFWTGRYRNISPLSGIVFVLAVAYLLLPIDLIGDYIPGLGQLDDAAILMAGLFFIEKDLYRYRDWKDGGKRRR